MQDDLSLRAQAAYQEWKQTQPSLVAVDTETSGLTFHDEPFCVTLAWRKGTGALTSHYVELGDETAPALAAMLAGTPAWVFHNAKFDLQKLRLVGLAEQLPDTIHDTECLAHLDDEHRPKKLKTLARDLLGLETDEEAALGAWFKKHKIKKADRDYRDLPRDLLIPYAVKDAEFTLLLFERLWPRIKRYEDLLGLYEMEMELVRVLLEMESHGMAVDLPYVQTTTKEYASRMLREELAVRQLVGDSDFNDGSWQQVLAAFEKRGITLPDTKEITLAAVSDPLAEMIVSLRGVKKMHGTYLLPIGQEQRDGVVHPWIRQFTAVTGRTSSGRMEE